ncbi:MAG: response regulator transcription factor [Prevotella sp.]|nr:response regulator transcription factor [Prevotella sp.]MBR3726001.1 response regulator transcription factor [Prevotella sp.]MBR7042856.1 response regulator transcription factor [Prevotella sp.]MBR7087404.1 response regulator transcription factor [Prevotella sp.]
MKILVVEDERELREVIVASLKEARFVAEAAATLVEARTKASAYEYDCILLDLMLPDGNGLDLLRDMAARGKHSNVIILSAKDSVDDKVEGLNLGADDYLPKPFHLAELHARIRSVMRRKRGGEATINAGNVVLYPDRLNVEVDGKPFELSRKEYDILSYLMNRTGRLVEKQTLAEAVWGDDMDVADNFDFIYAHIKNLRHRLKDAAASIEIKTVYGFGYKLVET